MEVVTVRTKNELKKAKKDKAKIINVEGQLAKDIKKSKKVAIAAASMSGVALVGLFAAITTAPATGGGSLIAYAASAGVAGTAFTGLEIASIILASSIGLTLLIGIFKEYEEIEVSTSGVLKLRRKQSK